MSITKNLEVQDRGAFGGMQIFQGVESTIFPQERLPQNKWPLQENYKSRIGGFGGNAFFKVLEVLFPTE